MDRLDPSGLMDRLTPLLHRWNPSALLHRVHRMNFAAIMDGWNPSSIMARLYPAAILNRLNPAIEHSYQILDPSAPIDNLLRSIMKMSFIPQSFLVVPLDTTKFSCLPSLTDTSIMSFVIEVFKQNVKFSFKSLTVNDGVKWETIINTDEIIERLKAFPLPRRFQLQLLESFRYVEFNTRTWLSHFASADEAFFNHFDWSTLSILGLADWPHTKLSELLQYTCYGEIDDRKTMIKILEKEKYPPVDAYRLLCFYCIEDMVWDMWPTVRAHFTLKMQRIFELTPDRYIIPDRVEVVYFACCAIARDRMRTIECIQCPCELTRNWFVYLFKSTIMLKNIAGVRFFATKLQPSKKQQTLNQVLDGMYNNKYDIDPMIFFVILTHLDEGNKLKLFRSHPKDVVEKFINYPLVRNFMSIVELAQPFFAERDFGTVVYMLMYFSKIHERTSKKYYENPLPDWLPLIWDRSPLKHKKFFINDSILYILRRLACESPRHKLKNEQTAQRKERYAIDYWKTEKKLRVIFQDRNILLDYLMWQRTYTKKDRLRKVFEMHIPPEEMDEDIKEFLTVYEESYAAL